VIGIAKRSVDEKKRERERDKQVDGEKVIVQCGRK